MNKIMIEEKINQAKEILKEKGIDCWLIFVRESDLIKDPSIDVVVGANVTWQSAFLIHRDRPSVAIVGSLDEPNMKLVGTFNEVIGYVKSVSEPLLNYLNDCKPNKIAINYSTNNIQADGLTHGMYLSLMKILKGTEFENRLVSSEEIISALRGRKSQTELKIMKKAVDETLKIYAAVNEFLAPGKTEKEVAEFIKGIVIEKGFGFAWDVEHCPSVFTGPDTAGAHSGPTDRVIEKGHILNMDFGIKIDGYCSDLQRTWYILDDNENEAPEDVKRGFTVLKESINRAASVIKPGVKGHEVDAAARNYITSNGYSEYQHGLGHQVGKAAHDGGSGFFPEWERYGILPYLPIEKDQVYTIEPRLFVEGRGVVTMEEEIIVTETGCKYISEPQNELYLIK